MLKNNRLYACAIFKTGIEQLNGCTKSPPDFIFYLVNVKDESNKGEFCNILYGNSGKVRKYTSLCTLRKRICFIQFIDCYIFLIECINS